MPYGDGDGWDETLPTDSALVSGLPKDIRDVRKGVRIRMDKEHVNAATASAGGEHEKGSAKSFYQASYPTLRPDGTTTLNSDDSGRLLVRSDGPWLEVWNGTGFVKVKTPTADAITDGIITAAKLSSGFVKDALAYAVIGDQKLSGTDGGTFTSGAWRTHTLQTEITDEKGIVSISSNQFVLQDGFYRIRARACACQVDQHQIRLANITTAANLYGTSEAAPAGTNIVSWSEFVGIVEVTAGPNTFELQHRCVSTKASTGWGIAGSFAGAELYATVEITKIV